MEFRVPLDENVNVGACWHNAEPLGASIFKCNANELFRDALSSQLRRHECMRHNNVRAAQLVISHRKQSIYLGFEPIQRRVVLNHDFIFHRLHSYNVTRIAAKATFAGSVGLQPGTKAERERDAPVFPLALPPPSLRQDAADDQLQRMINHNRQQDQTDPGMRTKNQLRHRHTRGEGFF
jgi:hypothetical protein